MILLAVKGMFNMAGDILRQKEFDIAHPSLLFASIAQTSCIEILKHYRLQTINFLQKDNLYYVKTEA